MKRNVSWFKRCLLLIPTLMFGAFLYAQDLTVTGTVTSSEDGQPIPGVSVVQKGTTNGTITDIDGNYNITVPQGAVIVFSFVGMDTQEVTANTTTVNIAMVSDVIGMDEVVVTALGVSREKKALGYAVSELKSEELTTVKDPNVINSLSGKVAGVNITQSTSGPGGGSRVIIRGNNSITGNNQPLYVVDGVPIDNSGAGSAAGGGTGEYARADYGTGISDINPDDIESMTVLKGPNAAALYGSRAGNGVILITTKKGSSRKGLGVSVSSSYTFDNPLLLPQFQDQYGQGSQGNVPSDITQLKGSSSWGPKFDGSSQAYWTGENKPYVAQPDNVKDFFDTGSQFINTIALEGGNENANLRFSYTNNSTSGILPNSEMDRHNFNLRGFANLTDKLSVDAKVTFFHQDMKNRAIQGTEGVMAYVYPMPRNLILNDLKTYQNPEESLDVITYSNSGGNPYWILNHDTNKDRRQRWTGFAKVTYEFTPWLSAFARVGTDMVNTKIETISMPGHHFYKSGRFNFSTRQNTETNADFLFMLDKDLTDDLNLNFNFGGNHSYRTYESMSIFGEDFKIPAKATVSNAVILNPGYTPTEEKIVNSLYASASFSFKDLAYLDLTARNDWSSTLSSDNWSYFYPSVSASVLLHRVIPGAEQLFDMAKVRVSWAQVGNDTGVYQLYEYYNLAQDGYLGRTVVTRPSVKFNEDLKAETITSSEAGLEWSMFNHRLYGDFSWYDIKTKDLIFDVPVPASTGYSSFRENVGELKNSGVELMLGGSPVQTGNFTWDISFNYANNKNELVSLIEDTDVFIFSSTNSGNVVVQATVGGGYGDIYGTTIKRTEDGRQVVDAAGRPQASEERVKLGNYQPDWTGGITNTFTYKEFSLRFLIDARFGGELYSGSDAGLDASGVSERTLLYRETGITVDGVVDNGDGTFTENTTNISAQDYFGAMSGIASEHVYDATNVRLRELSLTYRFPKSILGDGFIKGASLSFIGRNLFFIYKELDNFDPESSFSTSNFSQGVLWYNLPTTRSLGFNLNVNF
ncbi:SusC/RagA family TonB-linked outer membrane protein [Carboxylicivirga mesophila]|uniref:SusC/RagA family TonB-linked outer membrane protein n=1 Tax=Carboxylicivirga mesophila TaxID=1166478 RepID=A0ABS5KBI9_9BACT|nr:SusC/RagA family TonB-linked outer membrane protein [Carboxylicivirga mesophila]MBS2212409.1 SusC/RagA family TonB-linked outer membrane protein [Carboxylicivirga mesophila]